MTEADILITVTRFLQEVVGDDWDDEIVVGMETSFAEDLELESIEFVELSEKMQAHFEGIDFAGWLSNLELNAILDLTVGEVVTYVAEHAPPAG